MNDLQMNVFKLVKQREDLNGLPHDAHINAAIRGTLRAIAEKCRSTKDHVNGPSWDMALDEIAEFCEQEISNER